MKRPVALGGAPTGTQVVGIDVSTVGVAQANARAQAEGVADHVRFHVSDIATLPLPATSVDAAMSVDMLVFVPDIEEVMAEMTRVLQPGARFAYRARDNTHDQRDLRQSSAPGLSSCASCRRLGDGDV